MFTLDLLLQNVSDRIVFSRIEKRGQIPRMVAMMFDDSEPLSEECYYIGDWRNLPEQKPNACGNSYFLCTGGEAFSSDIALDQSYKNIVVFTGSAIRLHNSVAKELRLYYDWSEKLQSTTDLQALTELVFEKTGRSIAIVNSFFQRVAQSRNNLESSGLMMELWTEGRINYDRAMEILPVEKEAQGTDRFYFTFDGMRIIDQVIRQADKTTARVFMECTADDSENELALAYLDDLIRVIRPLILTGQTLRQYFSDAESMLIGDIIDQKITDPDEIEQRRKLSPDMVKGPNYHPIVFKFMKQAQRTPYNYISGRLKEIFPRSSVATYNNGLVVLAAKSNYHAEIEFDRKQLMELLEQFDGYAGIGNCTRYLTSLRALYIQAAAATRLGRVFSKIPGERIFFYRDYELYFMVDLCIEAAIRQHDFGYLSYLCHQGLISLIEYDRNNSTQLMETLRVYLECGRNATVCAQTMKVHRNTINYRLNLIEDICGYKLENEKTIISIYFSLLIMDYQEKYLSSDPLSSVVKMTIPQWDEYISMTEKQ